MASCKVEVTYPEPGPVRMPDPIDEVVLRMTELEAGTLRQILSRIGGDPTGPRGTLDNIGAAIVQAGVEKTGFKTEIYCGSGPAYLRIEKGDDECSMS